MSPKRVQMSRQHPWRAEHPDAVIVARPSRWGSPFKIERVSWTMRNGRLDDEEWIVIDTQNNSICGSYQTRTDAAAQAVALFREALTVGPLVVGNDPWFLRDGGVLVGRDLACWCPLEDAEGRPVPCHADVLLEIANADYGDAPTRDAS